jgi:flavin-dependent dehydrogenase
MEVIIVGGGPAGVAAAISCKQAGFSSTIVTCNRIFKHQRLHFITPAESIHPGVISLLARLNAAHIIPFCSRGSYNGIRSGILFSVLGKDMHGEWIGHHLDKPLFHSYLLQCAKQQGVHIIEQEIVADIIQESGRVTGIVTKSGKHFRSGFVIDASGSQRIGGRRLGFIEKFFSPVLIIRSGVSMKRDREIQEGEVHFIPERNGWIWIAPERGCLVTYTRLVKKGYFQEAFNEENSLVYNMRWRLFRPLVHPGILLTGDAAGLLDPASGQGILSSLISGIQAAHTAIACLKVPASESLLLANYDNWFLHYFEERAFKLKALYGSCGIDI